MIKKSLCIVLVFVMSLNFMSVISNAQTIPEYNLSLSQAIDMAKEYSPELECCDVNEKNYQVQLKSASIAKKDNKNTPVYVSQNHDLVYVKAGYYVEAAKSQIRLAFYERKKTECNIAYGVTQKYFTVKNAARMCEIALTALERASDNKKIIQKQFDMGACTELDVKNMDIALKQCQANADKCAHALALAQDSLKISLGIEGECVLNLTDNIDAPSFEANLEKDTQTALENRYDVNALKESTDLAKLYFEISSDLSTQSSPYFSAYTKNITARHNFNTGIKNIKLLVKNAYYAAVESQTDTAIAAQKLEVAKNSYEVNKIRYEMGMISALNFAASSDELTSAENAYENALFNQKMAIEKYNYEILIGLM